MKQKLTGHEISQQAEQPGCNWDCETGQFQGEISRVRVDLTWLKLAFQTILKWRCGKCTEG